MYVCICTGVTDRQIKAAVDDGASSLREITNRIGVASQCGECAALAKEIIDNHLMETAEFYEAV